MARDDCKGTSGPEMEKWKNTNYGRMLRMVYSVDSTLATMSVVRVSTRHCSIEIVSFFRVFTKNPITKQLWLDWNCVFH